MTRSDGRKLEELDVIAEPYRSALCSMYHGQPQIGSDGEQYELDKITKVSPNQARALYDFCVQHRPKSIVEIGMAYGFSSICYLAAMADHVGGRLISIDPFQHSEVWNGIGVTQVRRLQEEAGNKTEFRLVEDRSDRAAVDLVRANERFDLIFIDGNHRYDDVITDFYLFAQLCQVGGHIIFDDMWMPSIRTVVDFITTNRTDFRRVSNSEGNISVFECIGHDERNWDHFKRFKVAETATSWLRGLFAQKND